MFGISRRVIRIEWDGDTGFPVWGGFWISRHHEGVGLTANGFGWRLEISIIPKKQQHYPCKPRVIHWKRTPASTWIMWRFLDIHIGPAYGGHPVTRNEK